MVLSCIVPVPLIDSGLWGPTTKHLKLYSQHKSNTLKKAIFTRFHHGKTDKYLNISLNLIILGEKFT